MKQIKLSRNRYALVDDEDFERVNKINWSLQPQTSGIFYAITTRRFKHQKHSVQMHRFILRAKKGVVIDHINRDGLDNRKCNLRYATTQTNAFNKRKPNVLCTSKFKGVLRRHGKGKWLARIKYNNKHLELGQYDSEEKAAAIYNFASRIMFGEYRRENMGDGIQELNHQEQWMIFKKCNRYIEKYGWYIDTEVYHSFFIKEKEQMVDG